MMEDQEHIPHREHLLKGKRNTWDERLLLRKCCAAYYNKHFKIDSKPMLHGTEVIPYCHYYLHTQLTVTTAGTAYFLSLLP